MSGLAAALAILGLSATTAGLSAAPSLKGRKKDYNLDDYDWNSLESRMDWDDLAVWDGLDDATKRQIINQHYTNRGGLKAERIDEDALLDTLAQLSEMSVASEELGEKPDFATYLDLAQKDADVALNELEGLRQFQVDNFNEELGSLASSYNTSRNAILSNQYQQNAQLMDNMTSQLDKQNRNALEAGASAGMRLAGNINTLLSTQNKQSQTSLETANQLAQMMVNQRNAEASVRGRYGDYMSQHFATRQDIKDSVYGKAYEKYDAAQQAYADADSNSEYSLNPAWSVRNSFKKHTPASPSVGNYNPYANVSTSTFNPTGLTKSTPSKDLTYDYYKQFGDKTPW